MVVNLFSLLLHCNGKLHELISAQLDSPRASICGLPIETKRRATFELNCNEAECTWARLRNKIKTRAMTPIKFTRKIDQRNGYCSAEKVCAVRTIMYSNVIAMNMSSPVFTARAGPNTQFVRSTILETE